MELSKNYLPAAAEEKWYQHWMDKGYFRSQPDERQPFTVVIPPPNVTGVLHMGHTLNETVQDILVRHARMSGFNACWVPGSDHASIATEAKVVDMLKKEKGIDKSQLTRETFLQYAYEWKDKYGGIIYSQIKKLGCSCDWDRVTFTMDDHYYAAVIKVFIDLYQKGLIYRGARMINWDPAAKTALSDEEVEYREVEGRLFHVKYQLEGSNEYITIATGRPETIMGDSAICVNPTDERYTHLKGQYALVPLINRRIPIIFDEYVDKDFGTGCLKVTPAHDINDYNLGLKHNLEIIDTLNDDGTLAPAAQIYVGLDRFVARKRIVEELKEKGLLVKEETYPSKTGMSQRTNAVVEPRISTQWFVKMSELAKPALEAVVSGDVQIHPGDRFMATYKYWMENVKDWCISRQLWWGQRIPAFYAPDGTFEVAGSAEEALARFQAKDPAFAYTTADLTQDEDCLDTWFSSWLWPIQVFKGITEPENADIQYYYPTSVLVTGQDIIFFWVARMIMAGLEYKQVKPFSDVYFTGMVRDKQGRKMSKSLGNSPDLLELIKQYGADAVRFGIMISSPAGNDLLFDDSSCEQGRNFANKIWNALKLVKMWETRCEGDAHASVEDNFAIRWFTNRLAEARASVEGSYKEFRLSEALKTIYSLVWDDFCSWYLEWIKPGFEQPIQTAVFRQTITFFEELMQLLHPFMPFVTEDLYHHLSEKAAGDDLIIKQFAPIPAADAALLTAGNLAKEVITAIRDARNKHTIKPKDTIVLHIETANEAAFEPIKAILAKQVNATAIHFTRAAISGAIALVIQKDKFYLETETEMDPAAQKAQLEKDLAYYEGFLQSVDKKLSNERFVQHAKPEIIALERQKKADAEARIKAIGESLKAL
ncbi:MAG TPA: valine--tRNA ligase [Chitinophaga sp.]